MVSIKFEEGCTAELAEYAFASCYKLSSAEIPSTMTNFGENVFRNADDNFTIYGVEGSEAQNYATQNSINFSSGRISIIDRFVTIESTTLVYEENKDIKPNIEVRYLGEKLVEGNDYAITYDLNLNEPGEHQAIINGIGKFTGEVTEKYKIEKAESKFTFSCEDIMEGESLKPQFTNPANQDYYYFITNSKGQVIKNPYSPGVYTYHCQVYSNDYYKSKSITQNVTIKAATIPLQSIQTIGSYYYYIYVGDVIKLGIKYNPENTTVVKNVQWSARDESVVKVSNNGEVTAVGVGTTYVEAWLAGKSELWKIQVKENSKPLQGITINSSSNIVMEGETKALSITMNPTDATCNSEVKWSSSNENIAKVDNTGKVTGIKEGTAVITATKKDKTASYTIIVKTKLPFTDVPVDSWFYTAVEYTYKKGIILGTSDTTFNPNTKLTRGMLVTILHRMEGKPTVNVENKFKDVYKSQYYYDAVKWAASKGIVHGYDNGNFGPDNTITRQDLAVILRNYAQYKGKNINVTADLTTFKDGNIVSDYAKTAMQWAVGKGVITGNSETNTLTPHATSTRAEAASMLYKYCTKVQ